MIKKFENFIFDFDGTMVNSNKYHSFAFRKALDCKKKSIEFDYENIKGLTTRKAFKKIGIKNKIEEFIKLKKLIFRSLINKIKLYKNCKETIISLKKKNKKIFIVSGSSQKNINFILRKNKIKTDGIIHAGSTKFSKPHIMPYKTCLKKFKLKKNKSVAVEDSLSGLISAKKNGLATIGINNKKIKDKSDLFFLNFSEFLQKSNKL